MWTPLQENPLLCPERSLAVSHYLNNSPTMFTHLSLSTRIPPSLGGCIHVTRSKLDAELSHVVFFVVQIQKLEKKSRHGMISSPIPQPLVLATSTSTSCEGHRCPKLLRHPPLSLVCGHRHGGCLHIYPSATYILNSIFSRPSGRVRSSHITLLRPSLSSRSQHDLVCIYRCQRYSRILCFRVQ